MNKKILYGFLPIFLSLVVLFAPIRAAAAYDDFFDWDGDFEFKGGQVATVTMQSNIADYWDQPQNNFVTPDRLLVSYDGSYSDILTIKDIRPYNILDGTFVMQGTFVKPTDEQYVFYGTPSISFNNTFTDSISVGGYMVNDTDFRIEIQFNQYFNTASEFNIPISFNIGSTIRYSNIESSGFNFVKREVDYEILWATDFAGTLKMYEDMQNNPSMDSYFADQNQTIIDQSQTQNNLTNQQNTLIQNQTSQQHQDSQAEINQGIANSQAQINQSIQNTDQITNGYNSGVMGEAEDKFSSGAGDLTDIEDSLTDSSSGYVESFTSSGFDTSFLQSVGPSLNYVVTWFTNFWNMGGALTSTYGLSFAIFIAFYILRVRG